MGVCLRGKMTDAGLLGPTPAVVTAETDAPPAEEVAVIAPVADAGIGTPALDVTPAPEVPSDLIAATFGLLRAEPDGSVVIAGSGTPGTEIEVYSDETLLGKATVETSGDWVLVPDGPIPTGGSEITLAEVGKTGRAAQSFVVVINDDRTTQPLVVASTPGAISEVLQGMVEAAAEPATQVAVAEPTAVAPTNPAAPSATPAPVATPSVDSAPPVEAIAAEAPPAADVAAPVAAPAPVATAEPAPAPAVEPAATPALEAEAAPAEPAAVAPLPTPVAPAAEEAAPGAVNSQPAASDPAVTPEQPAIAVAAGDPVVPPTQAPVVAMDSVTPTIDAIEIEGARTFFAGAGQEGATIRLYVDDSFIADATVTDGRWLVEAGNVLSKPDQRVRIDVLEAGSAKVASRAEVNFVVDLPPETAPVAVAEAPAVVEPVAPAAPAATEAATPPAAATAEAPAVEPATTPAAVAEVDPAAPAAVEPGEAPVPASATVEGAVPTMVAVSFGSPDAQRFSAGKAIIRRGDNLWTIARRVYGEGIKYTAIYDANTGQIRDPDRIYPGQVFELPN